MKLLITSIVVVVDQVTVNGRLKYQLGQHFSQLLSTRENTDRKYVNHLRVDARDLEICDESCDALFHEVEG